MGKGKKVYHKARGFLASLSPRKVLALYTLADSAMNAKQHLDAGDRHGAVARAVDGVAAAAAFNTAAKTSFTAPGLVGEVLNWSPGKKFPKITPRRLVNAAPSAAGWSLAVKGYADKKAYFKSAGIANPKTAAMTGIVVGMDNKVRFDKPAAWNVGAPVLAGGAGSKIVQKFVQL